MNKLTSILVTLLMSVSLYAGADSVSITYYKTGEVETKVNIVNDKKDGMYTFYNQDGSVRWERSYKNGVTDGTSTFYSDDGSIYSKTTYDNGKFVESIVYNQDGSIAYISKLENGKCTERNASNKVIYEESESTDKYCR